MWDLKDKYEIEKLTSSPIKYRWYCKETDEYGDYEKSYSDCVKSAREHGNIPTRAERWIRSENKHMSPATNRGFLDGSVVVLSEVESGTFEWIAFTQQEWEDYKRGED